MQQGKYDIGTAFSDTFDLLKQRPLWCLGWGAILVIVPYSLLLPLLPWLIANSARLMGEEAGLDAGSGLEIISNLATVVQMLLIIPVIAAIIRLILNKPRGRGFWGLRLGMDELWVFVCNLAILVGFFCIATLAILLVMLGGVMVALSETSPAIGIMLAVIFGLAILGLVIWVAIRVSLFLSASIDLNTLALSHAWRASKGHFWPLFGTGLLAALLILALSLLWFLLFMAVIMVAAIIGTTTGVANFDEGASFSDWLPLIIGGGVVMLVPTCWMTAATYVLQTAPFASAWRQLRPRPVVADEAPFERM